MQHPASVGAQFVRCAEDELATVVWTPPPGVAVRFAVLHVPAAFEEMNKSRRSVALQARALAKAGGVVAVYDPAGTGDSTSDHGDATWALWRANAQAMLQWLEREANVPSMLWGLRLGALLAADVACRGPSHPAALILWQPVASGRTYFQQFLRLASVGSQSADAGSNPQSSTFALQSGGLVELAGYRLHPDLVRDASETSLETLAVPPCRVIWRESSPQSPAEPLAASARIARRWIEAGVHVDLAAVVGPSFWAATEIEEAEQLVVSTAQAVLHQGTSIAENEG